MTLDWSHTLVITMHSWGKSGFDNNNLRGMRVKIGLLDTHNRTFTGRLCIIRVYIMNIKNKNVNNVAL